MKNKTLLKLNILILSLCIATGVSGCSKKDSDVKESDSKVEASENASEENGSDDNASDDNTSNEKTDKDDKAKDSKKASSTDIGKGMSCVENGDYDTALSYFASAIEGGEDKKLAYRGQGIAYMGRGDYPSAEAAFICALNQSNGLISKTDLDVSYYLAVTQYKLGKADEAYGTYSAIIGIDKNATNAYFLRGKVSLTENNTELAIADFDKAISLEPVNYTLYENIYEALTDSGHPSEAKNYLDKAMENDSKMSDYQKGVFAYYLGNYTDARNFLETARKKKETDDIIKFLGKTYEALGDTNYAISLYGAYLDKNPKDGEMYNFLGVMKMNQKDYVGALELFQKGIGIGDTTCIQSLKFNEIVAYEYMEDFSSAKERMEEYVKDYPDDTEAQREYIFLSTR